MVAQPLPQLSAEVARGGRATGNRVPNEEATVRRCGHAADGHGIAGNRSICPDGASAPGAEGAHDGSLRLRRHATRRVVNRTSQQQGATVAGPALHGDDALSSVGDHLIHRERLGYMPVQSEPGQSRHRQDHRVERAGLELAQACVHIATDILDRQIATQPRQLNSPAQAARTNSRPRRKVG